MTTYSLKGILDGQKTSNWGRQGIGGIGEQDLRDMYGVDKGMNLADVTYSRTPLGADQYQVDVSNKGEKFNSFQQYDRGWDWMKDVILPGAAILGGGYMLGSALGGGAAVGAAGEAAIPNALGFGLEGTAGYVVPETTGALGFGMGGTAGYTIPTGSGLTPTASQGLGLVDKAVDAIKKNPKPIVQAVGGLLGGASGGGGGEQPYNGPMPTITQGGFLPSVEAQSMPFADVSQPMPKKKGQQTSGLWRFLG